MRNRNRRRWVEDSIAHPPSRARRSARRTRINLACVEPPDGGPAIALFSEACEARATLAEGGAVLFMLARANGDPLLHLRLDSGHLFTDGL